MDESTQPEPTPEREPSRAEPPATDAPASRTDTSVWYFVGATFLFAGPMVFGFDDGGFLRILTFVLGAVVFVCGAIVFRREYLRRR